MKHYLNSILRIACSIFLFQTTVRLSAADSPPHQVGVAQVNITPDYPVRLNGFGFRRAESDGVLQDLWAKALFIQDEQEGPALLITIDNLSISDELLTEIARRLATPLKLKQERLSITATHTHSAPMLQGVSPTIFGVAIPPEHQSHIDRYTREFLDNMEKVALAAAKSVRPARLTWGIGNATFAFNRRTKGGPVDHDLPFLAIHDLDGKLRSLYFSYACHCVALSGNKINGDWAGFAQDSLQKAFPGIIALASVGCGADSNPAGQAPGKDPVEVCKDQGRQISDEVQRVLKTALTPIRSKPIVKYQRIDLPFDTPRTRAEWEERARSTDYAVAFHAKLNLERLNKGEPLPTSMTFPIQSWIFGEDLAIVFLPGETVVDYSLRLKKEFDRSRLWINGYSNEGRCYIPSERIWREGGYEGGHAMIYYDRPHRFAPGMEQKVIDAVHAQLPASYLAPKGTEGTRPTAAADSIGKLRTKNGLKITLVAAEPFIADPVAIDWGADGRLWVCEMNDYPSGLDQNWQPGGRIKFLEDTDGDGKFDRATLFAEGLAFPTGVTAWGKGVLICAAPDVIYAEDTNGDGKADKFEKIFSGFATENYQARVNSLAIGLDNWIYGANGLLGGAIRGQASVASSLFTSSARPATEINIRGRDFRFHPRTGVFEAVSGLSQQGRVRDDWGNWFGCDNSQAALYFPWSERYIRRNPHIPSPAPVVNLAARSNGNQIFPISRLHERYNDLDQANRVTSACGIGVYRDDLLGSEYYGNLFTCEAVHNLVHREILHESAGGFVGQRAADESASEFFSSLDNWSRPAQVRTGPDGGLYIVDMYRFLIEHPRWIAASRLSKIDILAGSDQGRIYRLEPESKPLRPIKNLAKLSGPELAAALESPNGTERDRVHTELLLRRDPGSTATLEKLASQSALPQVRIQALTILQGMDALPGVLVKIALDDSDPRVRKHALQLAEPLLASASLERDLASRILNLSGDASPGVRQQVAFTLGEWPAPAAGATLAALAKNHPEDANLRVAILSSAAPHCAALLAVVQDLPENLRASWLEPLVATAAASNDQSLLLSALKATLPDAPADELTSFASLNTLLDALDRKQITLSSLLATSRDARSLEPRFAALQRKASQLMNDSSANQASRAAALKLAARGGDQDLLEICKIAMISDSSRLRTAAFAALRTRSTKTVPEGLISHWTQASPAVRLEAMGVMLERDEGSRALLDAVQQGKLQKTEVPLGDRQRLARHQNPEIQRLASALFPPQFATAKTDLLQKYQGIGSLPAKATNGFETFSKNCAACHAFNGVGHDLGPNLALLKDKDSDYWVKNILDPNAIVEPRFVSYEIETADDRSLNGVIKNETANSLVLMVAHGTSDTILRSQIKRIQASSISLMPEGLEQAIEPQQMADLLAFLRSPTSRPAAPVASSDTLVLRDVPSVARLILDAKQPSSSRETAIQSNPQFAADLITEMTRDLVPGTPEEYVRIPWIWRVAIACGKRNDLGQMKRMLAASLPENGQPLRDWQAVVIGGGLINGISQRGVWPAPRIGEMLENDANLKARWQRTLDLSSAMTDDVKIPAGTRYDALRILGVAPWDKRGQQLAGYLKHANAELQMGAVSGLADVPHPEAATRLIEAFSTLTKENQKLALEGLLRDDQRITALLDALASKKLSPKDIGPQAKERLKNIQTPGLRSRAVTLLESADRSN